MEDKPKTASQIMMENHEERRIEARDRQLACSLGNQMVEQYFEPAKIEDMADVRVMIQRAAEMAAYHAIQKERALHAGDMAMLKAWSDAKWAETVLKPIAVNLPPLEY